MYGLAVDDWTSSIASPHTVGDGHLVLATLNSLPVLPAQRIYRLTAVVNPGLESEIILGVFEATGVTGSTLTGVTASSGYSDINLSGGVTVQIRVCKATIKELQDSLDTINSNLNSQVVHVTGNETIAGVKTFTSTVVASITGNSTGLTGSITESQVTNLVSDLALKAPLASPALTGTPTAPTATGNTNTTQIATTAFVQTAIGGVGGGTVASVFGRSGAITATTGDYTVSQVTGAAPLASPTFTGTVTIAALILDTIAGLLKASTGVISAAIAGTDYLAPGGDGSGLAGVVHLTGNQTAAGNKTWTGKSSLSTHTAPITVENSSNFDCSVSDWHSRTLDGSNGTLTLVNDSIGQPITILLTQDGTGSRTVTWWSGIVWSGGTTPTLTATPGRLDVFTFKKIGTNSYIGFTPGKNFF